ncbi:GAF domain-containing protein [Nocardioides caeni]|uniref:GAF domain-containing protein n=1 Tax=Nocardioides caeni TaxID=574700 RepID=A0A4S8NJ30_9ACTN|nr:GAF domain-containing protein [Nocardioides caeni]
MAPPGSEVASIRGYSPDPEVGGSVKTTAQILAAIDAAAGSGRSLPELLCVDCKTALGLSGCVMALMNDAGHQGVVGASGGVAAQLEDLQFELGEGPSVNASYFARPVFHSDLVTAGEMSAWPGFGPEAVGAGVRAVFAFPLQVGGVRLGTLCLYRSTAAQLDREEMASALAYADAALVVLLRLQAEMQPGSVLYPDLGEPLEYRAEVHQATGFLSVQASVGLADALLLLRAHAFAGERSFLEVARDVLAGRLRIPLEEDEDD